jgi:hypothetical protein
MSPFLLAELLKGSAFYPSSYCRDMRKFMSSLPKYYTRSPKEYLNNTGDLEVGDYVVSPLICVERKSILDLFQSFACHLYNQVETMIRYYKIPVLLIEFSQDELLLPGIFPCYFYGLIDLCNYKFYKLEKCHYKNSSWTYATTTIPYLYVCHFVQYQMIYYSYTPNITFI